MFKKKVIAIYIAISIRRVFANTDAVAKIERGDLMVRIRNVFSVVMAVALVITLDVAASASQMLVAGGMTVGIELETNGVVVSRLAEVETETGKACPARDAGIMVGDCIVKIGGSDINSGSDFIEAMGSLNGEKISVTVERGSSKTQLSITPVLSTTGSWQLGMWLRDGASGIGTVTFYDPDSGVYGALGHGVYDVDNGTLMPSSGGTISPSVVVDIIAGEAGVPGELCGYFDARENLGSIAVNTDFGIYGTMSEPSNCGQAMETAENSEICSGPATILSNISGDVVCEYSVEILQVDQNSSDGKNMIISITDPDLLAQTGGIVQGMSGSPILQNGKLVGAVTHVFVSDPTRGYGIFIESMLETAESIGQTN